MLINWEVKVLLGVLGLGAVFFFGYTKGRNSQAAKMAALTTQNAELAMNLHQCQDNRGVLSGQIDSLNKIISDLGEESARAREYNLDQIRKAKDRQATLEKLLQAELEKPMPQNKDQWIQDIAQSLARQMENLK